MYKQNALEKKNYISNDRISEIFKFNETHLANFLFSKTIKCHEII